MFSSLSGCHELLDLTNVTLFSFCSHILHTMEWLQKRSLLWCEETNLFVQMLTMGWGWKPHILSFWGGGNEFGIGMNLAGSHTFCCLGTRIHVSAGRTELHIMHNAVFFGYVIFLHTVQMAKLDMPRVGVGIFC